MANEAELLALTRQVRDFKKAKNWSCAANALRQQKRLLGEHWVNLELAKVLQHAGCFDEAISEIEWLLAHSRQQLETPGWAHLPQSTKEARHQEHCAKIHDTAALICKREKRPDLASFHQEQATRFRGQHAAVQAQAKQDYQMAYVARGEPFKAIMESDEYRLDREATAFRKMGDWQSAIAALEKRKSLLGSQYQDTKLAKYLQAAGRFDESLTEIQWLQDNSHAWAQSMFSHQSASVVQCQRAGWCARIHDAAVLICKRANRPDLQAAHQQLYDRYIDIAKRLRPLADADRKTKLDDWEIASQRSPDAMADFRKKDNSAR